MLAHELEDWTVEGQKLNAEFQNTFSEVAAAARARRGYEAEKRMADELDLPYPDDERPANVPRASDSKPIYLPPGSECFLAGTPILMADGAEKPIEEVRPGDRVMSFDPAKNKGRGGLVPGQVTRTFQNVTKTVIDLHGLQVTPGHRFLTGEGTFETVAEILRQDGTIVHKDRGELRARTDMAVGSAEDRPVEITYTHTDGKTYKIVARAGIPCLRRRSDNALCSLAYMIKHHGGEILPNGLVRMEGVDAPVHWSEGTPLDHAAQLNFVIRDIFGRPYIPAWIEGLSEEENMLEAVGDFGSARPGSSLTLSAPGLSKFRPTVVASNAVPLNRRERRKAAALERVK